MKRKRKKNKQTAALCVENDRVLHGSGKINGTEAKVGTMAGPETHLWYHLGTCLSGYSRERDKTKEHKNFGEQMYMATSMGSLGI